MSRSMVLCKYFLIGCPNQQCTMIHDAKYLTPFRCPEKDRCLYDRTKSTFDSRKRPCTSFHPHERFTRDEIVKRAIEYARPITKESVYEKTKRCTGCPTPSLCSFAHSDQELVPLVCPYGTHCPGSSCSFHEKVKKFTLWSDDDEEIDFSKPPVY